MHTVTFKSAVIKRSVVVAGHKTSVSLEDAFWKGLKEIAGGHHLTLSELIAEIDSGREHSNLSSAIRLFVLDFYRNQFSRFETSVMPPIIPPQSACSFGANREAQRCR